MIRFVGRPFHWPMIIRQKWQPNWARIRSFEDLCIYLQNSTAKFSTDSIMVSSEEADTASMTSSLSSPVDRFFTNHCSTSSSFLRSPEEEQNKSRGLDQNQR